MALDGIFLSAINDELQSWIKCRVDKIQQISKFEVVLTLRQPKRSGKLLISSNSNSARINFSNLKFQSPKNLFAFCAVLRKHLIGARLIETLQLGLDRVLFLKFENQNEIGDRTKLCLAVEIMGKHSNIILFNSNTNLIVDGIKHIDENCSKKRQIAPNLTYFVLNETNKLNVLKTNINLIFNRVLANETLTLAKSLTESVEGMSSLVARELADGLNFKPISELDEPEKNQFFQRLELFQNRVKLKEFKFIALIEGELPKEFCWFEVEQYGDLLKKIEFESASELLEFFYEKKALIERMNQRCFNIKKRLETELRKVKHKKMVREQELIDAKNCDEFKKYGDLLSCNMLKIKKGNSSIEVDDFYNDGKKIVLKLDVSKTPSQNVQSYYNTYRKSKVAKQKLVQLIADCDDEIQFLNSELDLVSRAETETDVLAILDDLVKAKLYKQNFKKNQLNLNRKLNLNFLQFETTDGFKVLSGKNNGQNDYLTTKKAHKTDLWFHVKNFSGSHVVLFTENREVSSLAIVQAATIAVANSSVKNEQNIGVDYTLIKNVKKPKGSKPGMVIFKNYKTIYVNADRNLIEKLKIRKEQ